MVSGSNKSTMANRRRFSILFLACLIAATVLVLFWSGDRSSDRAHRQNWHNYGDSASALNKFAHSLGGRSRFTAWMQFYVERLQHRYERESEAEMEALIRSGYLVRTSFPVANLSSHREEVGEWFSLPSGDQETGGYEGVRVMNEASNLVTIICRPRYAPIFATLFVWRSPVSSLQQRAEAAAQLVARGAKRSEAEHVLGQPTRYAHFRAAPTEEPAYAALTNGPSIPAGFSKTNVQNLWRDVYDFTGGGYVSLCYDAAASNWSTDQPLIRIWFGYTNAPERIRLVEMGYQKD